MTKATYKSKHLTGYLLTLSESESMVGDQKPYSRQAWCGAEVGAERLYLDSQAIGRE